MFEKISPVGILEFGVIGFGFLLAFLTYRLLRRLIDQNETRKGLLTAIYVFMVFSGLLVCAGIFSQFLSSEHDRLVAGLVECIGKGSEQEQGECLQTVVRLRLSDELDATASDVPEPVTPPSNIVSKSPETNSPDVEPRNCIWRGKAPLCNGKCVDNEVVIKVARSDSDPTFGNKCLTGKKAYCCSAGEDGVDSGIH